MHLLPLISALKNKKWKERNKFELNKLHKCAQFSVLFFPFAHFHNSNKSVSNRTRGKRRSKVYDCNVQWNCSRRYTLSFECILIGIAFIRRCTICDQRVLFFVVFLFVFVYSSRCLASNVAIEWFFLQAPSCGNTNNNIDSCVRVSGTRHCIVNWAEEKLAYVAFNFSKYKIVTYRQT